MEEEIQETPQQPQPIQPLPVEQTKKSKLPLVAILIVVILLIATGGVYAGMQLKEKQLVEKSFLEVAPTTVAEPSLAPTLAPDVDETADWKIFSDNNLIFKYPPTWTMTIAGKRIEGINPVVIIDIADKEIGLMNECMQVTSTSNINEVTVKRFSQVKTGEMCSSDIQLSKEIWVVSNEKDNASGISFRYSDADQTMANEIFNKILSTFKFIDSTSSDKTAIYEEIKEVSLTHLKAIGIDLNKQEIKKIEPFVGYNDIYVVSYGPIKSEPTEGNYFLMGKQNNKWVVATNYDENYCKWVKESNVDEATKAFMGIGNCK